jgi:two-component system cell cycle response regulator CpdR
MARILLAEDDESMRVFLANALKRAGHRVRDCAEGLSALDAIKAEPYDLLLADIVMPGMDGIELARQANEVHPTLKVLFITGFAAVALNAKRTGRTAEAKVLSKPFHLRDLVAQIDRILAA